MPLPHSPNRPDELWQPARLRALIADDSDLYAEAISLTFELEPAIELVGRAADGREAVELALALRPDVVLMDLDMPVMDGIEATKAVVGALPSTRVVMVTASGDAGDRRRAEEAGAAAYVRKGGFAGELLDAVFGATTRPRTGQSRPPSQSPPARPPRRRAPATTHALRASR